MSLTFKKWLDLQDALEEAYDSPEKLDEVFGSFFRSSKKDDAKRAQIKKQFELNKKKREAEKAEQDKVASKNEKHINGQKIVPSGKTSSASQDKVAERDWLDNIN